MGSIDSIETYANGMIKGLLIEKETYNEKT